MSANTDPTIIGGAIAPDQKIQAEINAAWAERPLPPEARAEIAADEAFLDAQLAVEQGISLEPVTIMGDLALSVITAPALPRRLDSRPHHHLTRPLKVTDARKEAVKPVPDDQLANAEDIELEIAKREIAIFNAGKAAALLATKPAKNPAHPQNLSAN